MIPSAIWRPLQPTDIEALTQIANEIHPTLPESAEIFLERINLYPRGCLALETKSENESPNHNQTQIQGQRQGQGQIIGYAISHPIHHHKPPKLNTLLGSLDPDADCFYIHDIAILPGYRGQGHAGNCVKGLLDLARNEGFKIAGLVSVYGTEGFWGVFGFKRVIEGVEREDEDGIRLSLSFDEKVRAYGEDAVYLEKLI